MRAKWSSALGGGCWWRWFGAYPVQITTANAHAVGTHAEAVALIDNVSDGGQIALTLKEGQAGAAYPSRPCTPPSSRAKHRALFRPLVASPLR